MDIFVTLAIAIGAGLLLSRFIKLIHLPNVTAFLIAGLIIGPCCLGVINSSVDGVVTAITNMALGFIAFSIGGEFKMSYIKEIGAKPILITLWEGLTAVAFVLIALLLLGVDTPMAIALSAIAAATAPAATLMVIRQYKARGKVSGMLLPVVAMDDALGLMVFAIASAVAQSMVSGAELTFFSMVVDPVIEIVESLGLGVLLGAVVVIASRFFESRGNNLALAIMCVFAGVGLCTMWGLSSLLCCMMIGAVMVNVCPKAPKILEQTDRFTPPIFLLFFVLSGAHLDLTILPTVGVVGAAYILARALGKYCGASLGAMCVKADKNIVKYLGFTLIPQAGVAIGMAQMAITELPAYGAQINTVVLAGTLMYELIGPVITKIALTKAGEIKTVKKPVPTKA